MFTFGGRKALAALNEIPSFGFIPAVFPRDPIEINLFLEHVALGQVIEPLISTDKEGNVAPGLAQKWEFSSDSKKIMFTLEPGLVFSTGAPLTAEDVKFSIERHMQSNSQSKPYLQCIEIINVKSKTEIEFVLNEAQPALIKALSRDHLGVLPKGWAFNKQSGEPYTGSGPYRAVKRNDGWHYVMNTHYRKKQPSLIPEWKILLSDEPEKEISKGLVPDYMPSAMSVPLAAFRKLHPEIQRSYTIAEERHYSQLSGWWYPHGVHYLNEAKRIIAICTIKKYLRKRAEANGFKIATGVIPEGVAGFLPTPLDDLPKCKPASQEFEIKVAVIKSGYSVVVDASAVDEMRKSEKVRISFFPFELANKHVLMEIKPDVVITAWAGGFNDPQGFLPILTNTLDIDLSIYFGSLAPLYQSARAEGDWTKRAEYFRSLNEKLQRQMLMAPGWKLSIFALRRNNLVVNVQNFRFSPSLVNVSFANSNP